MVTLQTDSRAVIWMVLLSAICITCVCIMVQSDVIVFWFFYWPPSSLMYLSKLVDWLLFLLKNSWKFPISLEQKTKPSGELMARRHELITNYICINYLSLTNNFSHKLSGLEEWTAFPCLRNWTVSVCPIYVRGCNKAPARVLLPFHSWLDISLMNYLLSPFLGCRECSVSLTPVFVFTASVLHSYVPSTKPPWNDRNQCTQSGHPLADTTSGSWI